MLSLFSYELNAQGFSYDVQPYKSMRFVGPFELRTVKVSQVIHHAIVSNVMYTRAVCDAHATLCAVSSASADLPEHRAYRSAAAGLSNMAFRGKR
jgi:hypothetical protein